MNAFRLHGQKEGQAATCHVVAWAVKSIVRLVVRKYQHRRKFDVLALKGFSRDAKLIILALGLAALLLFY